MDDTNTAYAVELGNISLISRPRDSSRCLDSEQLCGTEHRDVFCGGNLRQQGHLQVSEGAPSDTCLWGCRHRSTSTR